MKRIFWGMLLIMIDLTIMNGVFYLDLLPDFNERMVRFGAVLIHYRQQFAQALNRDAARHHRECSGGREQLEITYRTVSSVTDPAADVEVLTEQLRSHMESHQAAERASRMCLSGPHKDDLVITIDGREAKSYSSQGQTRTAALALKLAERELFEDDTGQWPVLLLGDVLSELDARRQGFVLRRINGGGGVITRGGGAPPGRGLPPPIWTPPPPSAAPTSSPRSSPIRAATCRWPRPDRKSVV